MNTRKIFTKLSIAIALVALAAAGAVWQIRSVHAVPPPDPDRTFGILGITPDQTMRLNVVNLSPPDPNRQSPPDPCRVLLSFRNAAGQPFTNNDGQPIRRVVELQTGESAFLDLTRRRLRSAIDKCGRGARTGASATASLRARHTTTAARSVSRHDGSIRQHERPHVALRGLRSSARAGTRWSSVPSPIWERVG